MNTNKTQAEQLPQDAVMQSVLKASDLRIGNKLLFLGDVVTFKNITEFREDGIFWIKTFEPKIESKNFHFKPIPLTEEWLNKLGLNVNKWFCENSYCVVEDKTDDTSYGWCMKVQNASHTKEIEFGYFKYVHELQNLYFALTGRELTVA